MKCHDKKDQTYKLYKKLRKLSMKLQEIMLTCQHLRGCLKCSQNKD